MTTTTRAADPGQTAAGYLSGVDMLRFAAALGIVLFAVLPAWGAHRFVEVPGARRLRPVLPELLNVLRHPGWGLT